MLGSNMRVRRMVGSRFQSQKDRQDTNQISLDEGPAGSIYLSCLALILQCKFSHNLHVCHERIFAVASIYIVRT